MKKRKYGYILLSLLVLSGLGGTLTNNSLNKKERKTLVTDLKDSKSYFLKSIKGLNDKQLDYKAGADKWSVRECAEHIALSEGLIFQLVENMLKTPAQPAKRTEMKYTDEQLSVALRDRSRKGQAPEQIKPTGSFKTMDELIQNFTSKRNDHIGYVKTTTEDLRNHLMPHPFFGELDAYQWLLLLSGHTKRHTDQIKEVMIDPGFPK